jgi:hypothetical protein
VKMGADSLGLSGGGYSVHSASLLNVSDGLSARARSRPGAPARLLSFTA